MDAVTDLEISESETTSHVVPRSMGSKCKTFFKKNLLLVLLILSMALGIGLGAAMRTHDPPFTKTQIRYFRYPGDLLMNILNLLILPLITSSLISGLASLDTRSSGKIGLRAIVYYLTTTLLAVITGIILVVAIEPGHKGQKEVEPTGEAKEVSTADTLLDLLRQAFPNNIIAAMFSKRVSTVTGKRNITDPITNETTRIENIVEIQTVEGINILGLVVFCVFAGVIIGRLEEKGKPLKDLFDALTLLTMQLVTLAIWYSPIGILFLVAAKVMDMDDPEEVFQQLLYYFITVMAGLAVHGFISLPLLYLIFTRKNPFTFMYGVVQALVTALGTASSSASLPVTMRCLEENNGIDPRVTGFMAPIGATINMDGTALYEAVAVIFIGQIRGFSLDMGQIIIISITATSAAIGAAGIPQAGLVTMAIVLSAVGFPMDDITLILAVDWLLDRFRTAINVWGDSVGAGIVAHLSRTELRELDKKTAKNNGVHNSDVTMTTLADSGNLYPDIMTKRL